MRFPLRLAALGVTVLLLCSGAGALSAQQATITGRVTDEATGEALANARIQATGTSYYTLTNQQGQYTLRGVAPGTYQLRILLLGYASVLRSVTVAAGQTATVDWALRGIPFTLEEIVTTATGEALTRELGNTVGRIEAARRVPEAPVTNVTDLLNGQVAGVNVLKSAGTTGQAARIRIRGLSSVSLSNDPVIYVDGVRLVSEQSAPAFIGGGTVAFLDDINPEDIESIEVVKGPSAATLYGTQAANGVIRIQTKRGRPGAARWNVYMEGGLLKDTYTYPSTWFSAREGSTTAACLPWQQALGQCTISALHELALLETDSTTPFATGNREQLGASVAGGTEAIRYYMSGEYERELGLLKIANSEVELLQTERGVDEISFEQRRPNAMHKWSGRANISATVARNLELNASIGGVRNRLRLPQTGDNFETIIGSPLLGSANPTVVAVSGGYGFARPAQAAGEETYRTTNHLTNSLSANWGPLTWLTVRSTVGMDYASFDDEQSVRNGQGCVACTSLSATSERLGKRFIARASSSKLSADANASGNLKLSSRIGSRTTVGAQYNFDHLFFVRSEGAVLPPGILSINAGAFKFVAESLLETKTLGLYVEQQFSLDDRLFLTGAVRRDANSAFGQASRTATYPKVGASFVALEGRAGWLNDVRLRGAYGASGVQPRPIDALTFDAPVTASVFGVPNAPGAITGALGDTTLKPERSREVEAGVDLGLLDNRVVLGVTVFDKTTRDALVARNLPLSEGTTSTRLENVGTVNNKGIEISINARPVESRTINWDVNIEAAGFKNRLKTLGANVPPLVGFGFKNIPDYPLFGIWWQELKSFDDANSDGFIDPTEVVVSDTLEFLGSSVPTRQLYVTNSLSLFNDRVRVGVMGEYKGGYVSLNVNGLFLCAFQVNCRANHDPTTSLEEQAKAVAGPRAFGAYAEDASFFRLRELSLTYNAPSGVARWIRARSASATITARNVFILTGFDSWDPENVTQSADAANYNFFQLRQPLILLVRFNLGY